MYLKWEKNRNLWYIALGIVALIGCGTVFLFREKRDIDQEYLRIIVEESSLSNSPIKASFLDGRDRKITLASINANGPLASREKTKSLTLSGFEVQKSQGDFVAIGNNPNVLITGSGIWSNEEIAETLKRLSLLLNSR